jgi:hypothetical protein
MNFELCFELTTARGVSSFVPIMTNSLHYANAIHHQSLTHDPPAHHAQQHAVPGCESDISQHKYIVPPLTYYLNLLSRANQVVE